MELFVKFVGDSHIVGYNVKFDENKLLATIKSANEQNPSKQPIKPLWKQPICAMEMFRVFCLFV
jgi:hypothetical protein